MGDHGKANLRAVGSEQDVFVDKKMSIANSTSWWSLISSEGTLIMLCTNLLPFFLTVLPFILRTEHPQITSVAFTSSSVTSQPGTPPLLTIALKSTVEGKIIFSNKALAQVAPAICRLLKSFMLSLTIWMKQTHPSSWGSKCANHMDAFQKNGQGDQTVDDG